MIIKSRLNQRLENIITVLAYKRKHRLKFKLKVNRAMIIRVTWLCQIKSCKMIKGVYHREQRIAVKSITMIIHLQW